MMMNAAQITVHLIVKAGVRRSQLYDALDYARTGIKPDDMLNHSPETFQQLASLRDELTTLLDKVEVIT